MTAKTVMVVVAEKVMAVVTMTIVTKTGTMTTGFAPPPPAPTVPPPPQWTHLSRPNPTLLVGGGVHAARDGGGGIQVEAGCRQRQCSGRRRDGGGCGGNR